MHTCFLVQGHFKSMCRNRISLRNIHLCSGAVHQGTTGSQHKKTRKEGQPPHNQLPPMPQHSRAVHHTSNRTPSPQHNVIPASFESLRRWRRRRWRRWRRRWRNSGPLYNPPGGGLMEQGLFIIIDSFTLGKDIMGPRPYSASPK